MQISDLAPARSRNREAEVDGNYKLQITNNKWFDKLTTLSQVEGQITMTETRNSKHVYELEEQRIYSPNFVLVIGYWNLRFIWNLVLGI
ncbi:MAG: hypothetical protein GTN46_09905 [Gammaproteobacteria bacterium]|nr:hypothetical protein [Gammaproteobacteria bacterium]NIT41780.1 hypothetical protein [Gammaproteobacteria bacterium]